MANREQLAQKFYHWIYGENHIRQDQPTYLINLEIGVSVRFSAELAMFADFEDFYSSIADVQFLYGTRPSNAEVQNILTDAWNFLALEDRILEDDLEDLDADLI